MLRSNCSLCVLYSTSNTSYRIAGNFRSVDVGIGCQPNQPFFSLCAMPSVQDTASSIVPTRKRSEGKEPKILSDRSLTSEQFKLVYNLTKRQMPSCIVSDTSVDYLRQRVRLGNDIEVEKADNMTKQLALEKKESRCGKTLVFKNTTLSSVRIGPSKAAHAH